MKASLRLLTMSLLVWCTTSQAQSQSATCVSPDFGGTAVAESAATNAEGGFYWIACPDGKAYFTVWLWSDVSLRQIGDRLDTIRQAPDKQAATLASWARNARTDWSAPKYSAIRAAARADYAAFRRDPEAWAK